MELAADEMQNFCKVWATVIVALSYCYTVGKVTPKGFTRFCAVLPVIAVFLALPLKLTSYHLGGTTAFFIAWLANFKLLLFAFGKGPLCSNKPPLTLPQFLAVSCLPIKILDTNPEYKTTLKSENEKDPDQKTEIKHCPSPQNHQKSSKSAWNYIIKGALLILIIKLYDYTDQIHPKLVLLIYCFHIYFSLEIILALFAKWAELFLGCELEPQFNEPLLSTSLQDFWGRRWNIMVNRILKPTVYLPTLELSSGIIGRKWAPLPAVMATFVVSALMHELIFYYLGRLKPNFEVTWFFLLHGLCLCIEIVVKKGVGGKWRVPRWVSGPATAAFVVATGFWLFLPPLIRAEMASRPLQEYAAVGALFRRLRRAVPL